MTETYLYDEQGQRIRRQAVYSSTVGDTVTYVPFVFYEQAVSAGGSVVTKHYTVNGERVAVRVGGALYYLYHDQVGSTILATDAITNVVSSRGYYAFGATRRSSGLTPTDRRFTGQVEDPTGLYYYNSRYYDPQLGQFISPDTIVPEPNNLLSYNRYLYANGNPLKYSNPTGHCASNEDGSRSEDDADCWSYVDEILKLWNNDPDYWNGLFKDQDTWLKNLATNNFFDKDWMFNQYETYLKSDSFTQVYNQQQAERAKFPTQKLTYGPTPCDPGLWDCTSLALDVTSLGLSVAQTTGVACTVLTGPLCGSAALALTFADASVTGLSASYTAAQYASGEASELDFAISGATTVTSFTPGIGIGSDLAAVAWDLIDPIVPDEAWWGHGRAY
ncbi:MAG: RHS repeat-associated core domain-containing protein [Caldilineaceae bacterium]